MFVQQRFEEAAEESAGRLMQRELVAIPEFWTVGQTIDYLRAKAELPDEFYDICGSHQDYLWDVLQ